MIFIQLILMADLDHKQPKKRNYRKLATPVLVGFGVASLCFAAAFNACQPIQNSEEPFSSISTKALTAEQNTLLNETINGIGRVESAAIELKSLGITPAITDKIEQDLREAMSSANCAVLLSRSTVLTGPRESTLAISGPTCPVSANFLSKYQGGVTGGPFSLIAKFKISNDILRTQNDVSEISLSGSGKTSVSAGQSLTDIVVEGDITTVSKGIVHFVLSNEVTTTSTSGGTRTDGARLIKLSFPALKGRDAFKAEATVTVSMSPSQDQSQYHLNGVQISKAEFESYWQKLGIIAF
jgi:hypothetical protein